MNGPSNGIDFAGIRDQHPIAETIGRYLELKKKGGEYVSRCPFHNDSNPSFYVVPRKHKAFCMACGWHGDVVDFIAEFESCDTAEAARRLTGDQLPNERPKLPELPPDEADDWQPVLPAPDHTPAYDPAKTYNPRRGKVVNWQRSLTRLDAYRDENGAVLGYVVRMEIDGEKLTPTVTWARHRDGRECWVSGRFPEPRPIMGLDDLAKRPEAAVLVVSGEKCREVAARTLGRFVCVTWAGGDGAVLKSSWGALYGRRVTLWPDADPSGWDACQRLAARLYGHAAEVRVIDPRDQVKGWDIADAVDEGMSTADIVEWVKPRISVWEPEMQDETQDESEAATSDDGARDEPEPEIAVPPSPGPEPPRPAVDWPDPLNLLGNFDPPVVRAEWLPSQVVDFVFDQADLLGADPSILALSVIVACASAIHDGIEIQPKRHDPTWTEQARLWGAIVGDPSTRKTPAIRKATGHLRKIDMKLAEESGGKAAEYERELKVHKKRESAWISADARGDAAGSVPEPPEPPPRERLLAEDITVEAMSNVLKDNARGVLVITDELSGWFGSMDAYKGGGGKDRGLWLEIYNGGPKRVDRVMRGTILVPNWSASMLGGIQPEAIRKVSGQLYDDGLLQRFMVVCGKGIPNGSQDRVPNMNALTAYRELLDDLYATQPSEGRVTLSAGAHEWRERMSAFSHGLAQADMLTPGFRSHLGKWDGLFARLLLVFHCIDARSQRKYPTAVQVTEATAKRVHDLMRYFLFPHAASFYMGVLAQSERDSAVEWLAGWILAERRDGVSLREVMQSYKRWRAIPDWQQKLIMRSLEDAAWLVADGDTLERRVNRWVVNPKVHEAFGKQAEAAKRRRDESRESVRQAFMKQQQ